MSFANYLMIATDIAAIAVIRFAAPLISAFGQAQTSDASKRYTGRMIYQHDHHTT
jgi:hypothetical protein